MMKLQVYLMVIALIASFDAMAQEPLRIIHDVEVEGSEEIQEAEEGEPEVYSVVERMPEFPGGPGAMFLFINKNVNYPAEERELRIQGTVYISFVVNEEGELVDTKVIRGVTGGKALEREALRVVNSMPTWTPGMQHGKPVKVRYNLPIRFIIG